MRLERGLKHFLLFPIAPRWGVFFDTYYIPSLYALYEGFYSSPLQGDMALAKHVSRFPRLGEAK
jgi:hypothetical protein